MLLAARKSAPRLEAAYAWYGRRLLRGAFAHVWVGGAIDAFQEDGPTIAFVNHSAWWDPILVHHLSHDLFRRDGYGVMQGTQLERYPFFRRIGCFGASTDAIADVRALMAYAGSLLRGGWRRTLWIFPQGALLPARVPITFGSGIARLARLVPEATLIPVAVRYVFRDEQRPECVVRVGEPVAAGSTGAAGSAAGIAAGIAADGLAARPVGALRRGLEQRLGRELAALDAELLRLPGRGPVPGYTRSLAGSRSLHELYDRGRRRRPGA